MKARETVIPVQILNETFHMREKAVRSIRVHAQADIYLMDEIFGGVGDEDFREKSEKVFQDTFLKDRTIVFDSQSLHQVLQFSHKVLLINMGKQIVFGEPRAAIEAYHGFLTGSCLTKFLKKIKR